MQQKGGFSTRFRSKDLDDPPAGEPADAERLVEGQGAAGDHRDRFDRALPEPHDRSLPVRLLDARHRLANRVLALAFVVTHESSVPSAAWVQPRNARAERVPRRNYGESSRTQAGGQPLPAAPAGVERPPVAPRRFCANDLGAGAAPAWFETNCVRDPAEVAEAERVRAPSPERLAPLARDQEPEPGASCSGRRCG
jgi:hypothetical protein